MIYEAYQAQEDFFLPFRAAAELMAANLKQPLAGPFGNFLARSVAAGAELVSRAKLIHERPDFGITTINVAGGETLVFEDVAAETAFGTLLHFRKEPASNQPRVLLVAPMAGHFATLLRDTVRTLLPDHDVYVTDWHNARDISRAEGRFGLDDYIGHLIGFLEQIGPGAHVIGVCQPCNALLAAVAVMAQGKHKAQPRSMTLMAGPVDARFNPTRVNQLAMDHPISWFEDNLITTVPRQFHGAHRRVYPGFLQLSAFMSMNPARHLRAHYDLFGHLLSGNLASADVTRNFYDEYFAVLDLPAEFYLETVERVFQDHCLARGEFYHRGSKVEPAAIRNTALLTVEGTRDDICGIGQTKAAHTLCTGIATGLEQRHLQVDTGHYGVFSGSRWQKEIYPAVRDVIRASN